MYSLEFNVKNISWILPKVLLENLVVESSVKFAYGRIFIVFISNSYWDKGEFNFTLLSASGAIYPSRQEFYSKHFIGFYIYLLQHQPRENIKRENGIV